MKKRTLCCTAIATLALCLVGNLCYGKTGSGTLPDKSISKNIMSGYKQVLDLYRSGKAESALKLVQKLSKQPLRVAPDSVVYAKNPNLYLCVGDKERQRLRRVARETMSYASRLEKSGDNDAAIRCWETSLSISRQAVHTKPYSMINILSGHGILISAAQDLVDIFGRSGDKARKARAESYLRIARSFTKRCAAPEVNRSDVLSTRFEGRMKKLPEKEQTAFYNREVRSMNVHDFRAAGRLVRMWDSMVYSKCRGL